MKQFFITVAGVFVGLVLFMIAVPVALISMAAASGPPALPGRVVLNLDLREGLSDQDQPGFLGLGGSSMSVMSLVEALRRAETDDKVRGVFVRLPEGAMEPAAADELRLAFERLKKAGKTITIHSQGLYPDSTVISTYELAASGSRLWMQPNASFQVTGIGAEEVFFRRFFDRWQVHPEFEQRAEYKNYVNPYLYSDFTPAHREAELGWLTSIYESAINAAAAGRRLDPAQLRTALEAGPYSAPDALAHKLIDQLGQVKEAEDAALKAAGDGARLVEMSDYVARGAPGPRTGPAIAVIGAEGAIVTGSGGSGNPLTGESNIYSDEVAAAFYKAIEDREVKAIVFRVNSPGGSDTASEQILAALKAARAAGKPVVVSMGTYAASGGYWISSGASAIVAEPTTLTGSIGMFAGKFALGEALARFGVDVREISVGGDWSSAFGMGAEMTPEQRAAFKKWIDEAYEEFIQRVATGRNLPADRVREIARGRVWTGAQAKELGLVDEVGGFYQAVARAQALAKLTGEPRLKPIRSTSSPFEDLERLFGAGSEAVRAVETVHALASDPDARAVLGQLREERLRRQGANVLAPQPY